MVYLVTHFTGILAYASAKEGSKLKAYVYPYIYPYFHQSWFVFTPIPDMNFNVYIRDAEHDWTDIYNETVNAHQNDRLGGNENLFLSLSSAVHYYVASVDDKSFVKKNDGSNSQLRVLQKISEGCMLSKHGKRPVNMETIIQVCNVRTGKVYAHYYKN